MKNLFETLFSGKSDDAYFQVGIYFFRIVLIMISLTLCFNLMNAYNDIFVAIGFVLLGLIAVYVLFTIKMILEDATKFFKSTKSKKQ